MTVESREKPEAEHRMEARTMECRGKLLLVEDEHTLRGLVAHFLHAAGYLVVEAPDGQAGVDRFFDSGPFDLALVDLNLPFVCGVEVCRRIRAESPTQPILICSAAIVPESEAALRSLGVAHYLTKPYHPDVLLGHIRERLATGSVRASNWPESSPARSASAGPPAGITSNGRLKSMR
jgi:DNA-binding response OmpR family regulator